jgi:hypothetical protein
MPSAVPAIAAGVEILVPQRMFGLASLARTLERYGHLSPAKSVSRRLSQAALAETESSIR